MADQRRGKRKSPCSDFISEINEFDLSPENSNVDTLEPDTKILKTDESSVSVTSTITVSSKTLNPQNEDTDVNNTQKVTEVSVSNVIKDENNIITQTTIVTPNERKNEANVHLKNNPAHDPSETLEEGEIVDSSLIGESPQPDILIKFRNEEIALAYKSKFLKFLETFADLGLLESTDNLILSANVDDTLAKEGWVVVDTTDLAILKQINSVKDDVKPSTPSKKRKKKSRNKKEKELFVLDTNPSLRTTDPDLRYSSKFVIEEKVEKNELDELKAASAQKCFNCGENHALRDCQVPKDFIKIRNARQKFASNQQSKLRYHLEEDQKYGHLSPGKISKELRSALGLHDNEIPPYIYRMRVLGYPPGWLEEAKFMHSNLDMFDIHGNNVRHSSKKKQGLDPEKIIDYPGFNVPLEKGVRDAYRKYNVPPYSSQFNKQAMLEYFEKEFAKKQDDFETCDMDVDDHDDDDNDRNGKNNQNVDNSDDEMKDSKYNVVPARLKNQTSSAPSPSLMELEQKKKALLEAMDDSSNSKPATPCEEEDKSFSEKLTPDKSESECSEGLNSQSQDTQSEPTQSDNTPNDADQSEAASDSDKFDTCNDTVNFKNCDSSMNSSVTNTTLNTVRETSFGTPILKSSSPFSRLPKPDNFMKDVSPVINFENLPNSTGAYEKMSGLIQKVRSTLKNLQGKT